MAKNTSEYWEKLLKLRYERLGKFIQLKGPMSIIVMECRLIQEAYYKGFWKAIYKTILQRYRSKWRLWRCKLTEADVQIMEEEVIFNWKNTPYSNSGSHKPLP